MSQRFIHGINGGREVWASVNVEDFDSHESPGVQTAILAAVLFDMSHERPLPFVLDFRRIPKPFIIPVKIRFTVDDGIQVFILNGDQFGNGDGNIL
jgi:hypothetical protein